MRVRPLQGPTVISFHLVNFNLVTLERSGTAKHQDVKVEKFDTFVTFLTEHVVQNITVENVSTDSASRQVA